MAVRMLNFDTIFKSRRLSRSVPQQLRHLGLSSPSVSFRFDGNPDCAWDALVSRKGRGRFRVSLPPLHVDRAFIFATHRMASVVYWLSLCPVPAARTSIDFSDGDQKSNAQYCWSAFDPSRGLLPDPLFFNALGFASIRDLASETAVDWHNRSDAVRWRGGPNGTGSVSADPAAKFDAAVMQRVRLCIIASENSAFDAKIVPPQGADNPFEGNGKHLIGAPFPELSWLGDKFAIDVDGHSNTWSNFLIRMHLGCCVFKVASQFGYRQWYYDRLKAWEHYVPVLADMSDLNERIDWARSNEGRAKEIAQNGQAFARSMTFESETAYAVNAMTERQGRSDRSG
jgi:hypothetical protein